MDESNKVFWNEYYKNYSDKIDENSQFSSFVYEKFIKNHNQNGVFLKIADLGCGNCRDSNLFAKHGNTCFSIDKSGVNKYDESNINFFLDDAENLLKERKLLTLFDLVYMRWFLHSMPYEKSNNVFKHAVNNLKNNGLLCVEVRSINDYELIKKSTYDDSDNSYFTTHKRWLYNKDMCVKLAKDNDCEIIHYEEGYFSPNKYSETENPLLIRVVMKKKYKINNSKNFDLYNKILPIMYNKTMNSYRHMNIMNKILEKHEIKHLAVAGTLLALNRNGGIIPWDNDIDIGFLKEDWDKLFLIKKEIEESGLNFKCHYNLPSGECSHCHFGMIDCFLMEKQTGKWESFYVGRMGTRCHIEDYKNIKKQIFGLTHVYAPMHNCSKTLLNHYGKHYYFKGNVNSCHFKDKDVPIFDLDRYDYTYCDVLDQKT